MYSFSATSSNLRRSSPARNLTLFGAASAMAQIDPHVTEIMRKCEQMMDVSDEDLATYRLKREEMSKTSAIDSTQNALLEEAGRNYQRLKEAEERGKHLL